MDDFLQTESYEVTLHSERGKRKQEAEEIASTIKTGTQNGRLIFSIDGYEPTIKNRDRGVKFYWNKSLSRFFKLESKSIQRYTIFVRSEKSQRCYHLTLTVCDGEIISIENINYVGKWNPKRNLQNN